jgi:hypothetical protein
MIRPLVIPPLATGAAAADSTFVSGAAEPGSTPPQPATIINPESLTGTVSVGHGFASCDAGVEADFSAHKWEKEK